MTTEEKIIKNKLGVIRLARTLGNVSQACKVMGYSRDSFYRFKEQFGQSPVVVGGELIDPRHATPDQKRAVYERLVATAITRGYAEGWASHRYRELFGCWPRGFVGELRATARLKEKLNVGA